MKKKLSALLLALVLILSLLPTGVLAADTPTLISSLSAITNSAGNYKLTANITVTEPYSDTFTGTFDGGGHTITLAIGSADTPVITENQAVFAICNGATIRNLKVDGAIYTSAGYAAGIAARVTGGTIEYCSSAVNITLIAGTNNKLNFGGITALANGTSISNCFNTGKISGNAENTGYIRNAGGIAGQTTTNASTIENCYNWGNITSKATSSQRVGGIVGNGNKAGTIENCYNAGAISCSSNAGSFAGYLANGFQIANSYYLVGTHVNVAGYVDSTAANSITGVDEEGLEGLASALGEAYQQNAGGYPTLLPPSTEPSLKISGSSSIYVQSSAGITFSTLQVSKKNMDDLTVSEVTWRIEKKGGGSAVNIATLESVINHDDQIIVRSVKGGIATVTASVTIDGQAEPVTKSIDIMVIPHITTAEIVNVSQPGAVAVGQTVEAKVNVLGGEEYDYDNFPELSYQWQYRPSGGSATNIPSATAKTFTIPDTYKEGDYIHVEVKCGGKTVRSGSDTYASIRSADYGILYPVAYDPAFVLPANIKDDQPLALPASHTVGGVTAEIVWDSDNPNVISKDGTVVRPESGKIKVKLTAKFTYKEAFANKFPEITVWSREAVEAAETEQAKLQAAKDALGAWYKLYPVHGTDTNVVSMVSKALTDKGYTGIEVTLKNATEVYGNCGIDPSGDITYFYADPNGSRGTWFGSYKASFTLTKGDANLELTEVPVIIYWDVAKVKNTLKAEITDKVTEGAILAENSSKDAVTTNLTLPKVVDNKKWTLISWTSSDPSAIAISSENQTTADTLFNPYVGKVIRGAADKTVTLTAAFTFQRANDLIGSEPSIVVYKTFTVKVKALDGEAAEAARGILLAKLDAGFAAKGLTDYVTGDTLNQDEVVNDIQFPTTRDYGVDGKYFPVLITSSDEDVIATSGINNAARVSVYRPLPGDPAKEVTLTVTMADTANGISASKDVTVTVLPLTPEEINAELALMEQVKAHYFDGIKNANTAADQITGNLHAFQEAYLNENGELTFVYDYKELVREGIVPVEIDGWYDLQVWRLFKSSNPAAVTHENLLVTQQKENKAVTITSYLSSETLGKYAAKYPDNEDFTKLYYQPVTASLIVRGTNPTSDTPIVETVNASFTLQSADSTWISKNTISGLAEGSTVFDLFTKVLRENGYTYHARGSYVDAITTPGGKTLSELDAGENSGWMYKVNGITPSAYMAAYPLRNGDNVVVFFTKDYTTEVVWGDPQKPESGVTLSPQVTAKNGEAAVSVDAAAVHSALSSGGKVVIAPQVTGEARAVSVSLPVSAAAEIAGSAGGTLSVETAQGSVTLPNSALASVAGQSAGEALEIRIAAKTAQELTLPEGVPENALIVELTLSSGGRRITGFGGAALTLSLPAPAGYRAGERYQVLVISEDGKQETLTGMVVAQDGQTLVQLSVVHLSTFVLTGLKFSAFSDVNGTAWYYKAVQYVTEKGLMDGVGGDRFAPENTMTRGMLATVLYRLAGSPAVDSDSVFTDVQAGQWYTDAVRWAEKNAIVSGYGDGRFGVGDSLTREQLARMLMNYARYQGIDTVKTVELTGFDDAAQLSSWAVDAMHWAVAKGLITGTTATTLSPAAPTTRAQLATILMRFIEGMEAKSIA